MLLDLTDQNFEDEVLKSDIPVVVDFWAPWCMPCQMIAPITEKLAEEYKDKVRFCKLNVDENPRTAMKYQLPKTPQSPPTRWESPTMLPAGFRR